MPELSGHITKFLTDFKAQVAEISEKEFSELVQSLRMLKKCEDSNMSEEVERNWSEVLTDSHLFSRLDKSVSVWKCSNLFTLRASSFNLCTLRVNYEWFKNLQFVDVCYKTIFMFCFIFQIAMLQDLTLKEFKDWLLLEILHDQQHRRLSMQVRLKSQGICNKETLLCLKGTSSLISYIT